MKIDIVETLDGSHSLYVKSIDEHYHSTFGAIQESRHVFIQSGYNQFASKEIKILEIGFGTGLNCYLTLLNCLKSERAVHYYGIEKFPIAGEIWSKLNYPTHFPGSNPGLFSMIHEAEWNRETEIYPQFFLRKIETSVMDRDCFELPLVDLVYFDAFSPEKQPELWERSVFESLYSAMNLGGILVTYCAKGYVRRTLVDVGFQVERIPGPPGKREILRAKK